MRVDSYVDIRISRRLLLAATAAISLLVGLLIPTLIHAQRVQETYDEKFNIARDTGGVGVAVSADGKHVFVVGPEGILVSDDYGRTGTWVQTVRLK